MAITTNTKCNLIEETREFANNYFKITDPITLESALKVISYVTVILPIIVLTIKTALDCCAPLPIVTLPIPQVIPQEIQNVLDQVPQFHGYRIGRNIVPQGINLTAAYIRPANLFFDAVLGENQTTLPGSGHLFAIRGDHALIRQGIEGDREFTITAAGDRECRVHGIAAPIRLEQLYGRAEFKINTAELNTVLDSQKIYTAPLLPLPFYRSFKEAMRREGIVILPGNDRAPVKLNDLRGHHFQALFNQVTRNPQNYGFESLERFQQLLDLTIYQLGSLVVKTEDYYLLINPDGTIRARNVGEQDALRLINACGIRGIHNTPGGAISHRMIMSQGFGTALFAAVSGFAVFPAVGMGVWGGDPDLYWRAFLDAVIAHGTNLEKIFVNPRHQTTRRGLFNGCNGGEFQQILDEYRIRFANDEAALANLNKIINLYDRQTDVLHLSQELKKAFPDKIISLFNASDPDVTLGHHVGEYTNNINHANTTEENYTALGTNGLCFETITCVHEHPERLIQTV